MLAATNARNGQLQYYGPTQGIWKDSRIVISSQ